jgi:hypothetical protein
MLAYLAYRCPVVDSIRCDSLVGWLVGAGLRRVRTSGAARTTVRNAGLIRRMCGWAGLGWAGDAEDFCMQCGQRGIEFDGKCLESYIGRAYDDAIILL